MIRPMIRPLALALVLLTVSGPLFAAVQTKKIAYKDGDVELEGTLAWDDAKSGKRPGVLVVHEWWGLDDYARGRARQLAEMGYVAFALDMYGKGKLTEHPAEAREMATTIRSNQDAWRKRAMAGLEILKKQEHVDSGKLAAIGYCFGGSTCLQLAYAGADLKAVATFHAALPTPTAEEASKIKPKIDVFHGADDKFIMESTIKAFRGALDKADKPYKFVSYAGCVHSFTVPDADKRGIEGMKYDKHADEDSWKQMKELFAETLK